MRAAVITAPGGPEMLQIEQRPLPAPGPLDVLVRVHGSAMNRADVLQRRGRYPPPPGAPADIGGMEIAGTVVGRGEGATRWSDGARVFGLVAGGAHAEYVAVNEQTLAAIPDLLDWTAAAAVPEAFITASDALDQGHLRSGQVVLIHAVASGVGLAAVQLANARGAIALGSSRTAAKLAIARDRGLADGFDASQPIDGLGEWTRRHSDGRGADVVLDLVGGDYVRASIDALAFQGRLILIGTVGGAEATIPLGLVLRKRLTIRGTVLRSRALDERVRDVEAFARRVLPLLQSGAVRPIIDRVFALEQIADAHALVESNTTVGKVVIRMTGDR